MEKPRVRTIGVVDAVVKPADGISRTAAGNTDLLLRIIR
jgi:hypothetical protein